MGCGLDTVCLPIWAGCLHVFCMPSPLLPTFSLAVHTYNLLQRTSQQLLSLFKSREPDVRCGGRVHPESQCLPGRKEPRFSFLTCWDQFRYIINTPELPRGQEGTEISHTLLQSPPFLVWLPWLPREHFLRKTLAHDPLTPRGEFSSLRIIPLACSDLGEMAFMQLNWVSS